jgi:hypothetical protein
MSDEVLGARRKALEESFFHRVNQELLENIRNESGKELKREDLASASGIEDRAVLDHFVELGLTVETVAAIAIVPLVQVAWSDGKLDDKERHAVLSAAAQYGIAFGSSARDLLSHWLEEQPAASLGEAWHEYISAVVAEYPASTINSIKSGLLGRARDVAEASGDVLGLGTKISSSEEAVLAELEKAFGTG